MITYMIIDKMIPKFTYLSSVVIGLFDGSLVLLICRLIGLPITGVLLSVFLSAFVTTFVYNPSEKKKNNNATIRGVSASVLFSIIFGIMLAIYYVPKLGSVLTTSDISISASIGIILLITVIGGLIIGTIGGSIGSTKRDLFTISPLDKNN